jgi:hypothetical protein
MLDAVHMLKKLAMQGTEFGGAFFGTTLYWVGDVGCLWACLRAFHDSPDLAALVIGYATGYALTRRTLARRRRLRRGARLFALAGRAFHCESGLARTYRTSILAAAAAAIGLRHLKRWRSRRRRPLGPTRQIAVERVECGTDVDVLDEDRRVAFGVTLRCLAA